MKNLDKFFNARDLPWVNLVWEKHYRNDRLPGVVKKGSFWWKDILKTLHTFKEMAIVKVRNGSTCFFWKDIWGSQGSVLELRFPQAFSYAKNKNITVRKAFSFSSINDLFNLPVSQQAFEQLELLQREMDNLTLEPNNKDVWSYSGGNIKYQSAKAYRKLLGHQSVHPSFNWLWKSICQPKHKVFYWLLLNDRLSTRNILRRKQMGLHSFNCEFCLPTVEETVTHLFWHCPFAHQCWGILNLNTVQHEGTFRNTQAIKDQLNSQFFMVAVILMSWTIWKARNDLIFNNNQLSIQECKEFFFAEVKLVSLRVKQSLKPSFDQWLQSLQ